MNATVAWYRRHGSRATSECVATALAIDGCQSCNSNARIPAVNIDGAP